MTIEIPAGVAEEPLPGRAGEGVGVFRRSWRALEGSMAVRVEPARADVFRLTVEVANRSPFAGPNREEALKSAFVSAHLVLTVEGGEFVSLRDPPADLAAEAAACRNDRLYPVLVGGERDRRAMLAAPIILDDYPRVAPESPGDLFDSTEIDQLLVLNILTLSDEEKAEARATDPRAREILDRTEALSTDDFLRLNGVIRDFRVLHPAGDVADPFEPLERPDPAVPAVNGMEITPGSRVRLRPGPGGDIFDLALAGKTAVVEAIEQDYEDRVLLAVTLPDDPGQDLGRERQIGHRFYFSLAEVEPLGEGERDDQAEVESAVERERLEPEGAP